jgi:bifunctional oligoribonuclease and PAP phosphatase NrnA
MDELKFKDSLQKILAAKNILVTIHVRPDGDAIASVCILIELLENNKKNYFAYSEDSIPRQYSFLPHAEKINSNKSLLNFVEYDLIIALDCGSVSRTGLETEIISRNSSQLFIEFDHHPAVDDVADISNRYPECASTTEVLYHFLKANQVALNKNYANSILTGLLTDTDNFLFPITSDRSINIASEMLIYGAKFPQVLESTHRNKSLGAMRLWGQALSNLKINPKYNFAYTIISQEDIKEYDVSDEELENLSNFISNLNDAKGILVLQETGPNEIKGSLRATQSNLDVSRLARQLGGGGHTKAAGFRMQGKLTNESGQWKIV